MNKVQILVKNELRPCIVDGYKRALLRFFFIRAWTHGAAATVGGFTAGQEAHTVALVEYEDGSMDTLEPQRVRMLDSAELFGEFDFGDEGAES